MKFQTTTLLEPLSKESISRLIQIVDETPDIIGSKISKKLNSGITSAELWMIHRQRRNFQTRRFI